MDASWIWTSGGNYSITVACGQLLVEKLWVDKQSYVRTDCHPAVEQSASDPNDEKCQFSNCSHLIASHCIITFEEKFTCRTRLVQFPTLYRVGLNRKHVAFTLNLCCGSGSIRFLSASRIRLHESDPGSKNLPKSREICIKIYQNHMENFFKRTYMI